MFYLLYVNIIKTNDHFGEFKIILLSDFDKYCYEKCSDQSKRNSTEEGSISLIRILLIILVQILKLTTEIFTSVYVMANN